jgi:hypothetical protein
MKNAKGDNLLIRIQPDKKAALGVIAKKKNLDVSKLLMAEIDKLVEQNKDYVVTSDSEGQDVEPPPLSGRVFFIPLLGDEQRLNKCAAERLMKTSMLVKLIVRGWLTRDPPLPNEQLARFSDTFEELGAIGRNLNQLVKQAHSGQYPLPEPLLALLGRTLELTQQIRQEVRAVIKANIESWENDYA